MVLTYALSSLLLIAALFDKDGASKYVMFGAGVIIMISGDIVRAIDRLAAAVESLPAETAATKQRV